MKTCYLKIALVLLVFSVSEQSVKAQYPDSLKATMVKVWQSAKAYTRAYLDIMPADKYNFAPIDTGKVRTFSGQMIHLAQGNIATISTASGKQVNFNYPNLEHLTATQSKDSVTYCVMASYDYAINTLKGMDALRFFETVKNSYFHISRFEWIMMGFDHQSHQRSLCTMYIRLVGIKPPG